VKISDALILRLKSDLGLDVIAIERVQRGRHRIMALYQFGFTHVDIIVPDEQLEIIKPFLIKA
jgi:hypothetical protein